MVTKKDMHLGEKTMNSFSIKEVRKLILTSCCICIVVAGITGYFLGRNSDQAQLNKMLLAKAQEEQRLQAENKAKMDKYFAPLKQESAVIYGNEKGYAPWKDKIQK